VVLTTSAGYLSHGSPLITSTLIAASVGTALCASSASTFNQVLEVDRDKRMKRTLARPLPAGHVSKAAAAALGITTGLSGTALLYTATDVTTTMLGLGNIFLYAIPYTLSKPQHEINTWIGALVGAVPPVMGWVAAGGNVLDPESLWLGSTLFLWQFPHFFALSYMYREDYKRGGFQMVPCNDNENFDRTASLIARYTAYMSTLPLIAVGTGMTSAMFGVEGMLLNGYALYVAKGFHDKRDNGSAKKVFMTSLWYLPCLLTLFIFHSRNWDRKEGDAEEGGALSSESEDSSGNWLEKNLYSKIHEYRNKGKDVCLHENANMKDVGCPVTAITNVVRRESKAGGEKTSGSDEGERRA
jgi:protoheme IX farnesyltransferase